MPSVPLQGQPTTEQRKGPLGQIAMLKIMEQYHKVQALQGS